MRTDSSDIPMGCFDGLSNLQELALQQNQIGMLPPGLFHNNRNL